MPSFPPGSKQGPAQWLPPRHAYVQTFPLAPPPPSVAGWATALSQPLYRSGLSAVYQLAATPSLNVPVPPVPYAFASGGELRFAQTLMYQAYTNNIFPITAAPTTPDFGYFQPLAEPVRSRPSLFAASHQAFTASTTPLVSFGWNANLSEPVRQNLFRTALQSAYAATDREPIVSFSWFQPLADFVRQKPSLLAANQQFLTSNIFPVVSFGWQQPLSEPVRQNLFRTALQQVYAANILPITAAPATPDFGYFLPFSEPTRIKSLLTAAQQAYIGSDREPLVSFSWFRPLEEPVRTKPALRTDSQQAASFLPSFPAVSFGWYGSLSEPVRQKPALPYGAQQFTARGTDPVVSFGWLEAFSEPVRTKPFRTDLQQPFTANVLPIPNPTVVPSFGYFQPFSEPVRLKPALAAASQLAFAYQQPPDAVTIFNAYMGNDLRFTRTFMYQAYSSLGLPIPKVEGPVTMDKWFHPFSLPVRQKPGLLAALQRAEMEGEVLQIIQIKSTGPLYYRNRGGKTGFWKGRA